MEGIIEIPSPFPIGLADWNVGASVELRTLFRRFLRLNSHRHLLILRLFAFLRELEYGETLDWRLSVLQEITMHLLWHFSCLQEMCLQTYRIDQCFAEVGLNQLSICDENTTGDLWKRPQEL